MRLSPVPSLAAGLLPFGCSRIENAVDSREKESIGSSFSEVGAEGNSLMGGASDLPSFGGSGDGENCWRNRGKHARAMMVGNGSKRNTWFKYNCWRNKQMAERTE